MSADILLDLAVVFSGFLIGNAIAVVLTAQRALAPTRGRNEFAHETTSVWPTVLVVVAFVAALTSPVLALVPFLSLTYLGVGIAVGAAAVIITVSGIGSAQGADEDKHGPTAVA